MTEAEQLEEARRLLGFVYHRSRSALFAIGTRGFGNALSDINNFTSKYAKCWSSSRPQDSLRQWFGETP